MDLTESELLRYRKQIQLPEIGKDGQLKLKQSTVLVVGAGGLGSPVLLYLAAAGVGHISIIDGDLVTLSNLQRQVVHDSANVGMKKVDSAAQRLRELNPEIKVEVHPNHLSENNAEKMMSGKTVVVDCTDNLETRFLINSTCVKVGIPFVYGAVFRYEGQVSIFDAKRGPCLRCMYPVIPAEGSVPKPDENGLLATVPGIIGLLQATEVLKLIVGIGEPLIGRMLLLDSFSGVFKTVRLSKIPGCPVCGPSA